VQIVRTSLFDPPAACADTQGEPEIGMLENILLG
jgi:hypothetical protein